MLLLPSAPETNLLENIIILAKLPNINIEKFKSFRDKFALTLPLSASYGFI